MSALRLGRNPDGTRTVLILEPAVGRITHTRGAIVGGFQVVTETSRDAMNRQTREYKAREAQKARERRIRCGKLLPLVGMPCARTVGHRYDCKSAETMARIAAKVAAERRTDYEDPAQPTLTERQARRRAYQRDWQRDRRARERAS